MLILLASCIQCRVLQYQEIPLNSEHISINFTVEKDAKTGGFVGKLMIQDSDKDKKNPEIPLMPFIPDFEDRMGITDGKCAVGYRKVGFICIRTYAMRS